MPVNPQTTSEPRWARLSQDFRFEIERYDYGHNPQVVVIIALSKIADCTMTELLNTVVDSDKFIPTTVLADSPVAERDLEKWISVVNVGWHVVLLGNLAEVSWAHSRLFQAGMSDEEITPLIFDQLDNGTQRRVYCSHCRNILQVTAEVGQDVRCSCGKLLNVYYHYSRALGAFLGFQTDAEILT